MAVFVSFLSVAVTKLIDDQGGKDSPGSQGTAHAAMAGSQDKTLGHGPKQRA